MEACAPLVDASCPRVIDVSFCRSPWCVRSQAGSFNEWATTGTVKPLKQFGCRLPVAEGQKQPMSRASCSSFKMTSALNTAEL